MKLVGISGKSGSGKDFIGRAILRPMGYNQFSLAWPMKNEAVGHGYSYEDVHVNKPPAVREYLQKRGTEEGWMKYGENYWTKIADAWLRTFEENWNWRKFYIPDVRFPHEIRWLHERGAKIIRLYGRGGLAQGAEHPSETALDNYLEWDAEIDNAPGRTIESIRSELFSENVI